MDAESLTHIAGLNPLTQTGRLFDAVCTAFTAAPGQERCVLHIRNGTHRWRPRVYRSNVLTAYSCHQPLRRILPVDPVTYAEKHHRSTAIVVWPFDDEAPVLPGGWRVITAENQNVMTALSPAGRARAVIPLSAGGFGSVVSRYSSARIGTELPDRWTASVTIQLPPKMVVAWASWMNEHGSVLKDVCGERLTRLLTHPHRDFWFDPAFDSQEMSLAERQYLRLWWDTKYPEIKLAQILEIDPKTIGKTRRGLVERYGDNLTRLACRMGYVGDKETDARSSLRYSD